MSLSINNILRGIEDMPLYKEDYKIISNLLLMVDNKTFTKILEEVLDGNLYWSDFEKLLSNTNYSDLLEKNLSVQEKLRTDMERLANYREELYGTLYTNEHNLVTDIGLSRPDEVLEPEKYEFYMREYTKVRDNLLYELTKPNPNDSTLAIACKAKLETAIRNGEVLLNDQETLDANNITLSDDSRFLKQITVTQNGITRKYDYINPDDIFFFIGSYILPLQYKYQTLDENDKEFMFKNNISEDEMKQIKSLAAFLRRDKAQSGWEASNDGAN